MPLTPGEQLGHYRIQSLIGKGGMGEVYQALDKKLDRDVAIKVLPEALAGDPNRLARFEREAKVLAQLNHSGIAAIYGLEGRALVMELVPGPTLAERIEQGPIPAVEAEQILLQIADALEYAHERGIVHRDLKPANIKIDPEDKVKILDFGLAKALSDPTTSSTAGDPSESPTMTMGGTIAGTILGTAAYMAPEQARGKKVDRRADIWAFGVVVWEMLTGERLFKGEDTVQVLSRVLEQPPGLDRVPQKFRKLLSRCLDRNVKDRLRDIGEARFLLQEPASGTEAPLQDESLPHKPSKLPWAVAAALGVVAIGALAWTYFRPAPLPEITRFEILAPPGSTLPLGTPAVSPDGRTIAYTVADKDKVRRIYVRPLDGIDARVLPGTEDAVHPFFSPDGRSLGFVSDGKLRRIDLAGGSPRVLADNVNGPWHGSWNQNGTILFEPAGAIDQVPANGGPATPVLAGAGHPYFLPDGKRFLARNSANSANSKIELGTLGSQERKLVLDNASSTAFVAPVPGGPTYMFFIQGTTLMAQQFNEASGTLVGEPAAIIDNIGRVASPAVTPTLGVSRSGTLAFQRDTAGGLGHLTWVNRSGKPLSELPAAAAGRQPTLSPDGRFAAIAREDRATNSSDIWVVDLERGAATRLSFEKGQNILPVWSRDGKRIAYSTANGIPEKDASGTGAETLLLSSQAQTAPYDWSPDGKYLLDGDGNQLALLPATGDKKPIPVGSRNGRNRNPRFSPDGKYIAYESNESGKIQVYVQPTPPATGRWQVSTNGGSAPRWRRDGKELFFWATDGLMAVDVKPGTSFAVGLPQPLFARQPGTVNPRDYDVSADGQRFLIYTEESAEADSPITVVQNWWVALRK